MGYRQAGGFDFLPFSYSIKTCPEIPYRIGFRIIICCGLSLGGMAAIDWF
jgi:hypothetical protein